MRQKDPDLVGKYLGHLNGYVSLCKTAGIAQITTVFNPDYA